jgi:hypothetical protein
MLALFWVSRSLRNKNPNPNADDGVLKVEALLLCSPVPHCQNWMEVQLCAARLGSKSCVYKL